MIKLYGSPNKLSPNTLKIRVALAEANAPYEFEAVDLTKGEQRRPEYLAINPHAKIPALVDGDLRLAESNALLWYVAETFPQAKLLPPDPAGRARALQFCDFFSMSLYNPHYDLYLHAIANEPAKRNAEIAERARVGIDRALEVLETVLATREYLAGPFSIADIAGAATMRGVRDRLPAYATFKPATSRWFERVTSRPAWKKAVAEAA